MATDAVGTADSPLVPKRRTRYPLNRTFGRPETQKRAAVPKSAGGPCENRSSGGPADDYLSSLPTSESVKFAPSNLMCGMTWRSTL